MTTDKRQCAGETRITEDDPLLTAYALGELEGEDRARVEEALAGDPMLRVSVEKLRIACSAIGEALASEPAGLQPRSLEASEGRAARPVAEAGGRRRRAVAMFEYPGLYFVVGGLAAASFAMVALLNRPLGQPGALPGERQLVPLVLKPQESAPPSSPVAGAMVAAAPVASRQVRAVEDGGEAVFPGDEAELGVGEAPLAALFTPPAEPQPPAVPAAATVVSGESVAEVAPQPSTQPAAAATPPSPPETSGAAAPQGPLVTVQAPVVLTSATLVRQSLFDGFGGGSSLEPFAEVRGAQERGFVATAGQPSSVLGVQVESLSYASVRRALLEGRRPERHQVQVEQLINSFDFTVAPLPETQGRGAKGEAPVVATRVEYAPAPWNPKNLLVRIALQARPGQSEVRPAERLVLAVQAGMPGDLRRLLGEALRGMVARLRPEDRIVLARVGAEGALAAVCTADGGPGRWELHAAIERLLDGEEPSFGLEPAAEAAGREAAAKATRIILCGAQPGQVPAALANARAPLSLLSLGEAFPGPAVLGSLVARGSLRVDRAQTVSRARELLLEQAGDPDPVVARGAVLSTAFNPRLVSSYRLIGYEGAAGAYAPAVPSDLLAGQSFTALYEVVPTAARTGRLQAAGAQTLLTVRLRYEDTVAQTARRHNFQVLDGPARWDDVSDDFRFVAAVAAAGMVMRDSSHRGVASLEQASRWIRGAELTVPAHQREDFERLLGNARRLY